MNEDTRIALLQILEDRYEKKSVIIASQLPVDSMTTLQKQLWLMLSWTDW